MNEDQSSRKHRSFFQQIISLFSKNNSKEDLREYLQDAQQNHIIDTEEAAMLAGVLTFSEQRVRDVMLPKSKMVTVSKEMPFDEIVKLVIDSGHSRFPIADEEAIIGILLAKDLLAFLNKSTTKFDIDSIMREVHHIPESKPLNIMLREFRRRHIHMAIVTNEYGDVAGLLTIEDVLEEIVGEIDDEHDREETADVQKISAHQFVVNALTEVEDFNSYFNTDLDDDTYDTIGGHVLSNFGYVPKIDEQVEFATITFTVKEADERRIISLLVTREQQA